MITVSTDEMSEMADVTRRMLDHWHRHGVFEPYGPPNAGTGRPLRWDVDLVPAVAALGRVAKALNPNGIQRGGTRMDATIARRIFIAVMDGQERSSEVGVVLGDGVELIVDVRAGASWTGIATSWRSP